ncbi:MAG: glycosyltransferase family 39 protein [Planctomycetales bacterium]|nr:glycosyltransferase family 39 protein [Planctomycetales bacterium]
MGETTLPSNLSGNRIRITIVLAAILALAAVRLPSVWYRMGGQDEQWFSVPGWTVAHEGLPRIPYVPVREPGSVFYGADRILFALPPAYFYVQSPFFWLFPPGYGTARLAAWAAGIFALWWLYGLMRTWNVRLSICLLALTVCAFGRAFYFPWQDTRPDMLCAMFGLAALALLARRTETTPSTSLWGVGACVGLGMLSHPFALVYALQIGMWLMWQARSWRKRLLDCGIAGMSALAAFALWLPLIAREPALFQAQFFGNVLSRSGPGLVSRLLWPWTYVPFQTTLIAERLGAYQLMLLVATLVAGLVAVCAVILRQRRASCPATEPEAAGTAAGRLPIATWLAVSALYLHVATLGFHPAKGYLCYTWAMLALLLAVLLENASRRLARPALRKLLIVAATFGLILVLAPGSGLRATWTYATRYREVNYNRQAFVKAIDQRLPPGARLIVSPEYVFEFELLGRRPLNASRLKLYHDVEGIQFDYLLASTQAFDEGIPEQLKCELAWTLGDSSDPLACYVEVYSPTTQTPQTRPWPRQDNEDKWGR